MFVFADVNFVFLFVFDSRLWLFWIFVWLCCLLVVCFEVLLIRLVCSVL